MRRSIAAILVALPLAVLLIPLLLAPRSMTQVALRVGATEYAPLVALAAAGLGIVGLTLVRRTPIARWLVVAGTLTSLGLAEFLGRSADRAVRTPLAELDSLTGAPSSTEQPIRRWMSLRGLPTPTDVTERPVAYSAADGSPLRLRVFRGRSCGVRRCPMVAVLYGGAWGGGDASQAAPTNRYVASLGYVIVALDYRHAPRHRYPAQLDDVRRGLMLLRDSAAAWGGDVDRVALWGRSSGGHLATLTAWDSTRGPLPVAVRGVIDFYGPYDLAQGYAEPPQPDPIDARAVLRAFIGGTPAEEPVAYRAASPSSYVRSGLPPALLVYAGHDHLVKPEFGRAAAAALRAARVPVVYGEFPFAEHGFDLVPSGADAQGALHLAVRFLAWVLGS